MTPAAATPDYPILYWCPRGNAGSLYRELKRQTGTVTPTQQEWLDALTAAKQDAAVWRPSQFFAGEITASLKGGPQK